MVRGLEYFSCGHELRGFGLLSLGKTPGTPSDGLSVIKRTNKKTGDRLLSRACSDRTRGDGLKREKEGIFLC